MCLSVRQAAVLLYESLLPTGNLDILRHVSQYCHILAELILTIAPEVRIVDFPEGQPGTLLGQ